MGLEIINQRRKEKKMSLSLLSKLSGVPIGTIAKISAGITINPGLETLRALAKPLNCYLGDFDDEPREDDLTYGERKHLQMYRCLDSHGKKLVDMVLEAEQSRIDESMSLHRDGVGTYSIVYYQQPASAGTGQLLDASSYEILELDHEPPQGATFVVRVSGDSMEPTYHDGDKLFIKQQPDVLPGEIGIFMVDGEAYVKELGDGVLLSHNPQYPPIDLFGKDRIMCFGKVLGRCD